MEPIRWKTSSRFLLAGLQVFIGLTAIIGGAKLLEDPSGDAMGIPLQWLSGSPFRDYLIPGWTLLVVIGLGHAAASLLSTLGYRQYVRAAVLQGGLLVIYIAVEVWTVGLQVMLQPLYFMLGLVQIALGIFAQRKLEASCEGAPNLPDAVSNRCASESRR